MCDGLVIIPRLAQLSPLPRAFVLCVVLRLALWVLPTLAALAPKDSSQEFNPS